MGHCRHLLVFLTKPAFVYRTAGTVSAEGWCPLGPLCGLPCRSSLTAGGPAFWFLLFSFWYFTTTSCRVTDHLRVWQLRRWWLVWLCARSRVSRVPSTQTSSSVWNTGVFCILYDPAVFRIPDGSLSSSRFLQTPAGGPGSGTALLCPPCSPWQGPLAVRPPPLGDVCTLTGIRDGPAGVCHLCVGYTELSVYETN